MASDTDGLYFVDKDGNRVYPSGRAVGNLDTGSEPYKLVNPKDGSVYDLSKIGGGSSTDTHVPISEDGTEVVADPSDLNFGTGVTAAADGDGSATVTVDDATVRTRQAEIPPTTISDGNHAPGLWKRVPSGKTLKILEVGVQDSTQAAPTGLTVEVYDITNATTLLSKSVLHAGGAPLASKAGAIDVEFRVANATGGSVDASGYALYTME